MNNIFLKRKVLKYWPVEKYKKKNYLHRVPSMM